MRQQDTMTVALALLAATALGGCDAPARIAVGEPAGARIGAAALRRLGVEAEVSTTDPREIRVPWPHREAATERLRQLALLTPPPAPPRRLVLGPSEARLERRSRAALAVEAALRALPPVLNAQVLAPEGGLTALVLVEAPLEPADAATAAALLAGAFPQEASAASLVQRVVAGREPADQAGSGPAGQAGSGPAGQAEDMPPPDHRVEVGLALVALGLAVVLAVVAGRLRAARRVISAGRSLEVPLTDRETPRA